ncbi:MAG: RNA polymerase sigma factor [Acidobacteria bacterium]|nr:RNA polymerase sigma factor [Acidobacteriota bacterium]
MNDQAARRSDGELVEAANQGDRSAFEELYHRYRDWVFTVARRFSGNEDDACDVLQETFFYFFNKFPGFELRAQLKTFLYPVAKHMALNRSKKAAQTVPLAPEFDRILPDMPRDEQAERRELLEFVRILPEAQREVVMLRFADGLDLSEIAVTMGIPIGTVKSRLHQALAKLKENLQRQKQKKN